jgi:dihydrofolate reductase
MKKVRMILAMDLEGGIGKNGTLPWHIPEDLKMFKEKTKDCFVAMGKNTWNDPTFPKPMKGRTTIVFTRHFADVDNRILADNVLNVDFNDIPLYLDMFEGKDIWVIGGGKVYDIMIEHVDEVYLTQVYDNFGCDVFFDGSKLHSQFEMVSQSQLKEYGGIQYDFQIHRRVK